MKQGYYYFVEVWRLPDGGNVYAWWLLTGARTLGDVLVRTQQMIEYEEGFPCRIQLHHYS